MENKKSDLHFLYELDKNARASFASIGRTMHISAQESKRTYDALKESGILKYCYPIVDYSRLGYFFLFYLVKLHNMTKENEDELYRYLNATSAVCKLMRGDGYFDLAIGLSEVNMVVVERIFQDINSRFSHFIMGYETIIPTASYKFPRAYLVNRREAVNVNLFAEEEAPVFKVKKETLRVLEAINTDGRIQMRDASFALKMSYDKVKNNVRRLEEAHIIKGYAYVLNHALLGFPRFNVLLQMRYLSRPREQALFDYCAAHPNIVHYLRTLGAWQLALSIEIKNREELREVLRDMKSTFSDMIVRVETTELYHIDRYRDLPLELTLPAPIV